MTSNGYLINDDIINEAKELWQLKKIQITLDGSEKVYNHSKAFIYKDVNAYKRVIGNIHRLQNAGIHVSIRLNIDMYNAENLLELAEELHSEFNTPKGISIYVHALFGETKGSKAMHDAQKRKFVFEKIKEIEFKLKDYGFLRPNRLNREIKVNHCMADNDNSAVIVPSGHIGKCEHYSEDHFIGHIDNKKWDTQMMEDFRTTRDEIDACNACFDYPNCMRLELCENNHNCYLEKRQYKLEGLQQSVLKEFNIFIDKQQNEL